MLHAADIRSRMLVLISFPNHRRGRPRGEPLIWLRPTIADRLAALRGPVRATATSSLGWSNWRCEHRLDGLSRDWRLGQRKDRAIPALRLGYLREIAKHPLVKQSDFCLGNIALLREVR